MRRRPGTGTVTVSPHAAKAVGRGHPWVWRDAVIRADDGLAAGTIVELAEPGGRQVGYGLWDPTSPIAVRIFSTDPGEPLTLEMVLGRIGRALLRRDAWFEDGKTTAYRLCNGEGDRVPGLVIDRYQQIAVVRTDGDAMDAWLGRIVPGLRSMLEQRGIETIVRRLPRAPHEKRAGGAGSKPPTRIETLTGPPAPAMLMVEERGIKMMVDLAHGQKTGAFLDQRDNRERVRNMSSGRRVLNLFSYAGGFSTAAALGGAVHVTSVDLAHEAHATAQQSMRANGLDETRHAFITADAFTFLESARARKQSWDLVVSDPPSFAPNERALPRALAGYRKLHAAAAAVLHADGILCAASCSSHVDASSFLTTLDDATLSRRDLSVVGFFGAPPDHPIVAGWPEGRYLKFAVLR